jgi:threonine/homoserine/homoserine lactone efflux protein
MIPGGIYEFVITGAIFGLTAGISPGPLLTLIISQTLRHNKNEGIKVAVTPLVTDLPVITAAFFLLSKLSHLNIAMSLISFLGAIFLVYLGYGCVTTRGIGIDLKNGAPASFLKGIAVNILNPHPFLFWITVGVPVALSAYHMSLKAVILFFVSFYSLLIGSKITVAIMVEKSKTLLTDKIYILIMRLLGSALFIFAALFLANSIKFLRDLIS